jgi:hypothetical protein
VAVGGGSSAAARVEEPHRAPPEHEPPRPARERVDAQQLLPDRHRVEDDNHERDATRQREVEPPQDRAPLDGQPGDGPLGEPPCGEPDRGADEREREPERQSGVALRNDPLTDDRVERAAHEDRDAPRGEEH